MAHSVAGLRPSINLSPSLPSSAAQLGSIVQEAPLILRTQKWLRRRKKLPKPPHKLATSTRLQSNQSKTLAKPHNLRLGYQSSRTGLASDQPNLPHWAALPGGPLFITKPTKIWYCITVQVRETFPRLIRNRNKSQLFFRFSFRPGS